MAVHSDRNTNSDVLEIVGAQRTYRQRWEKQLGLQIRASLVNRFCINLAGNSGYRWVLWRLGHSRDPLEYMRKIYSPAPWTLALFAFIRMFTAREEES